MNAVVLHKFCCFQPLSTSSLSLWEFSHLAFVWALFFDGDLHSLYCAFTLNNSNVNGGEIRLCSPKLEWPWAGSSPAGCFSANGFFYMHLEEKVWFHLELGDLEVKMTVFFLRLCIACKSGCSKMAEGDWTWSANLFKSNSYDEKRQKVVWRYKNDALSQVYCTFNNPHFHLRCFFLIPYSRKYWRSLNLVVWSRAAEKKILADLNLAVVPTFNMRARACVDCT